MIAMDTVILVYAQREDSPWHHKAYETILILLGETEGYGQRFPPRPSEKTGGRYPIGPNHPRNSRLSHPRRTPLMLIAAGSSLTTVRLKIP